MRVQGSQYLDALRRRDIEFPKEILATSRPSEDLFVLDEAHGALEGQAGRVLALLKDMPSMAPNVGSMRDDYWLIP